MARVRVYARIRPPSSRELEDDQARTVVVARGGCVCVDSSPERQFRFDSVFEPGSTQAEIFEAVAAPAVEAVAGGSNGTVLAYGQTGTGKTYTMLGPTTEDDPGLMPLSTEALFAARKAEVRVSYVEVYQERVVDLLGAEAVEVRDDPRHGVVLAGAEEVVVGTSREALDVLRYGAQRRATAATDLNDRSSRSHTILVVAVDNNRLMMVDLAGSEKWRDSNPRRLQEFTCINKSLSALAKCVAALADGRGHVPYRDSKLTRVLRDALADDVAFVATVSPSSAALEETLSTLDFARRAMRVTVEPRSAKPTTECSLGTKRLRRELADAHKTIRRLETELAEARRAETPAQRCRLALRAAPPVPDDVPAALRDRLAIVEDSILAHADEVAAATRGERDALKRERDKALRTCNGLRALVRQLRTQLPSGSADHKKTIHRPPRTPVRRATEGRRTPRRRPPTPESLDAKAILAAAGLDKSADDLAVSMAARLKCTVATDAKAAVTRHLDPATGVYYYYDARTRRTSWEPPATCRVYTSSIY